MTAPLPAARRLIENRIVGHDVIAADQLLANPWNYRRHGAAQRAALNGSLRELGWIRSTLVNRTTGHMLDGHMRVEEALKADADVPVEYVELTEEEERLALAILDPMTGMAFEDDVALDALLAGVEAEDAALNIMLEELAPGGKDERPIEVKEIDVSATTARFWLSCRGPLPQQREALDRLRTALEELPGVEVEVGSDVS